MCKILIEDINDFENFLPSILAVRVLARGTAHRHIRVANWMSLRILNYLPTNSLGSAKDHHPLCSKSTCEFPNNSKLS